jgi:hypothetical protein
MGRLPSRLLAAATAAVIVLILGACSPDSGYVSSSSQGMFFKIPSDWHTYSQRNLQNQGLLTGTVPFLVAFDGDPKPGLAHVLQPSRYPWGLAEVAGISQSDQINFSLDSLLNRIIPLDQLQKTSGDNVSPISPSQVITRGTLHGVQAAWQVSVNNGAPLSYEQISLVNGPTTKTWVLVLGCSQQCFAQHRGEINRVVDSWIVKAGKS